MMKIKDWDTRFEHKNSTGKSGRMAWVRMSTSFDGVILSEIVALGEEIGPIIRCCWDSIIRIAATCEPRGTLIKPNGKPHDANSLGALSRISDKYMQQCIDFMKDYGELEELTEGEVGAILGRSQGEPKAKSERKPSPRTRKKIAPKKVEGRSKKVDTSKDIVVADAPTPIISPPPCGKPTPKDVLTAWDQTYEREHNEPYMRTAAGTEAKLASQIIKTVAKAHDPPDWQIIPNAIESALSPGSWCRDKNFQVFASQFAKYALEAKGKGGTDQMSVMDRAFENIAKKGGALI